jgi:hypothetical protein
MASRTFVYDFSKVSKSYVQSTGALSVKLSDATQTCEFTYTRNGDDHGDNQYGFSVVDPTKPPVGPPVEPPVEPPVVPPVVDPSENSAVSLSLCYLMLSIVASLLF